MPDYLPHIDQPHKLEQRKKIFRDWSCRVRFAMHELGENFVVLFFVGDVPEDPTQWETTSSSYIGSSYTYVWSGYKESESLGEDIVYLNSAIAERAGLSSYEPNEVIPYLRDNLHWRIRMNNATKAIVEPAGLPSLEVVVMSRLLTSNPEALPVVSETQYHYEITYGCPGGARQAPA